MGNKLAEETEGEKIEALTKGFDAFVEEAKKLEDAYGNLVKEFRSVKSKLEQTRTLLSNKMRELDAASHYLDSTLSHISQGIVFIDLKGTITTLNAAAEKMLNVSQADLVLKSFWDYFDDNFFNFSMREALQNSQAPETAFIERNEKEFEVSTNYVQNDKDKDFPEGIVILIRDITKFRQLEKIANRNNRMKELGEMAAMLAHEIRNPLGGIKGFASLLQRDLADRKELEKMATYVVNGTDNLNSLVTRVLNFSRPCDVHFQSVDLTSLLEDLKQHFLADSNINHAVEIRSAPKSLMAPIDQQLLRRALINLIVNAIHAMPDGGTVELFAKEVNEHAIISIKDAGIGITTESIDRIFAPFFTTKPDGNGFGLAEVLKIVETHDGTIEVDSTPGEGTQFTIKLPLKAYRG